MIRSPLAVLCLCGAFALAGAFTAHVWHGDPKKEQAVELAQRYLVDMHSGRCRAAQLRTFLPGSPEYCKTEGKELANVRVACDNDGRSGDNYWIRCTLQSTTQNGRFFLQVMPQGDRLLVIDPGPMLPMREGFGPP